MLKKIVIVVVVMALTVSCQNNNKRTREKKPSRLIENINLTTKSFTMPSSHASKYVRT
ncbi:MAG: hypothetical protein ACJ703_06540 [Nitrososphaera sp.]